MESRGIPRTGEAFVRPILIGRDGEMEMEFGYFTPKLLPGSGPIRSGILPSGRYMSVTWNGTYDKMYDVMAMLDGWAKVNKVNWECQELPEGRVYGCRLIIFHDEPDFNSILASGVVEFAVLMASAKES
jgi:hypothetical protein